jgi:hypothetical protein
MKWRAIAAIVLPLASFGVDAATCTAGQQPWSAGGFSGATETDACTAWASGSGLFFTGTEQRNNNGVLETWCDASSVDALRPPDVFQLVTAVCDGTATGPTSGASAPVPGSSADAPLYVYMLGPLSPASASSVPVLSAEDASRAFVWGFGAIAGMFALGWVVALGRSIIGKA